MALSGADLSQPLLTKHEQVQLLKVLQELRLVPSEVEAIRAALTKLVSFISLLKSRLNPSQTQPQADDVRTLLLKYLFIPGDHFKRLDAALTRATFQQDPDTLKIHIEMALAVYDELEEAELKPRLLRDTTQLMRVLDIIDELGDTNLDALTMQLEQMQASEIIPELRARKSLLATQELLVNLNAIVCRVESRISGRKVDFYADDQNLLLLRYVMLKDEEREQLLSSFEKSKKTKIPCISSEQIKIFNKFKTTLIDFNNIQSLIDKTQIDLLDIFNKSRVTDATLIKARDQLERLQLNAVIYKLTAPGSLLRLKDQLIKCAWLLAAIESRFSDVSDLSGMDDDHTLLLKYILLSEEEQEQLMVSLNTLRVVAPKSEDGPATIKKQLAIFNDFRKKELRIRNLSSILPKYISLSEIQRQQLLTIIKQYCIKNCDLIIGQLDACIKMLNFAKHANLITLNTHIEFLVSSVEMFNSLIAYAINQGMFYEPAMKKQIDKLNEKVMEISKKKLTATKDKSKADTRSAENEYFRKKFAKLDTGKETIFNIKMSIVFELLSNDLFLPIFESQMTLLNEREIKAHLFELQKITLDEIQTEEELTRLTTPFYVFWRTTNQTALQGFAASLSLFKAIDHLILLKLKKIETDDESESLMSPGISVDILEKIADSPALKKATAKRKLFLSSVDDHINAIESALELIDTLQAQLKNFKKQTEKPTHERKRSKSISDENKDKKTVEQQPVFIPPLALQAAKTGSDEANEEPLKQHEEEAEASPKKHFHPKRAAYKNLRGISAALPRLSILSPKRSDDSPMTDRSASPDEKNQDTARSHRKISDSRLFTPRNPEKKVDDKEVKTPSAPDLNQ